MISTTQAQTYPKYARYKDSGVEWLGKIPEGWNILKTKYIWTEVEQRSQSGGEILLSVSQYDGITPSKQDSRSESFEGYKLVQRRNLVINIMLAWMGGLGISDYDGMVSPAYCVYQLKEKNIHPKYLGFLYKTNNYLAEFARKSSGIVPSRWRMYTDDFGQVPTLLPPLGEQNRIVQFLDQKNAAIDAAIAKKQRLIELLKEQKAILINRAVTRGLSPDVPMKDSGVEWIGEIPLHWDIVRLKHFSKIQSGITLGKIYSGEKLAIHPYLRVANVQSGYFKLDDVAEITIPVKDVNKYLLQIGDILVTEGGDIDKLGRGTVWKGEIKNCLHQNHVFAVRVHHSVTLPQYASLTFEADYGRKYFTTTANKTTNLASTNSTKLGNFPVLTPPVDEQKKIVIQCENIFKKFDVLLRTELKSLEILQEYKQTLIAHAVTGKIKV